MVLGCGYDMVQLLSFVAGVEIWWKMWCCGGSFCVVAKLLFCKIFSDGVKVS